MGVPLPRPRLSLRAAAEQVGAGPHAARHGQDRAGRQGGGQCGGQGGGGQSVCGLYQAGVTVSTHDIVRFQLVLVLIL